MIGLVIIVGSGEAMSNGGSNICLTGWWGGSGTWYGAVLESTGQSL